jgi:hypothetical protein
MISLVLILILASCRQSPVRISVETRPSLEVVGRQTKQNTALFGDYSVDVVCRYLNRGGTGQVTVYARVDAQNGGWTKRQTQTIGKSEEREFTFRFPEVDYSVFGSNSYTYNCGWE